MIDERLTKILEAGDNPNLPVPTIWTPPPSIILRPYQRVGISFLACNKRFVLGDPPGAGKTFQEAYSWALINDIKPLNWWVVTTKTACGQWVEELQKVIPQVNIVSLGHQKSKLKRFKLFSEWAESSSSVIITSWPQLCRDWDSFQKVKMSSFQITADETQYLSNPDTKTSFAFAGISDVAERCHGLTGTLMRNAPIGSHSIMQTICPSSMMSQRDFKNRYCEMVTEKVSYNRYIQVIKSYHDLEDFAEQIKPVYLSRTNEQLDNQMPSVVIVDRKVELSAAHRRIYLQAEQGMFTAGQDPGKVAACMIHAQQAANCPEGFEHDNPALLSNEERIEAQRHNVKLELLKDLLDNDLFGEQVVVYCPFRSTIEWYKASLESYGCVDITGSVESEQRDQNRKDFVSGKARIMFLTDAGGEALNLQNARHLVMISRPYAPGKYLQVLGRIRRMSSKYASVTVWHLTAQDTVDQYLDAMLNEKFDLFKIVSGEVPFEAFSDITLDLARTIYHIRKNKNSG